MKKKRQIELRHKWKIIATDTEKKKMNSNDFLIFDRSIVTERIELKKSYYDTII